MKNIKKSEGRGLILSHSRMSGGELMRCGYVATKLENGHKLWLIPEKYYDIIPNGMRLHNILDESFTFRAGKTSDDSRGGFLAYGFLRLRPQGPLTIGSN